MNGIWNENTLSLTIYILLKDEIPKGGKASMNFSLTQKAALLTAERT